jgi:hypothetical protein
MEDAGPTVGGAGSQQGWESGRIEWLVDGSSHVLVLPTSRAAGHRVAFAPVPDARRLTIGLVTDVRSRPIDVSRDPGLVARLVDEAIGRTGGGADARGRIATRIVEIATEHRVAMPVDQARSDVLVACGAAAFPMLGAAYERGSHPRRSVPVWAATTLQAETAREAATAAFGVVPTRAVVRTLASVLCRPGPLDLTGLACARMAAGATDPDRLCRVLAQTPHRTEAPAPGADPQEPTLEDLERGRRAAAAWGPEVTVAVLTDALTRHGGVRRLAVLLHHWALVGHLVTGRLPAGLDALATLVDARLPTEARLATDHHVPAAGHEPAPGSRERRDTATPSRSSAPAAPSRSGAPAAPSVMPPQRGPATAEVEAAALIGRVFPGSVATTATDPPTRPTRPTRVVPVAGGDHQRLAGADHPRPIRGRGAEGRAGLGNGEVRPPTRPTRRASPPVPAERVPAIPLRAPVAGPASRAAFAYPPAWRGVDGSGDGEVRLVLPRTPAELARWGRRLHNCLADFAASVHAGTSLIVGVEVHDVLRYAVEVTPAGEVRQFLGAGNRAPDATHVAPVIAQLRAARLLRPVQR